MAARRLRLVAAAATAAVLAVLAVLPAAVAPAVAATPGDDGPPLRIEILDTRSDGLDRLIALVGAPHDVDVTMVVTNIGSRVARDVVTRAETTASAAATRPVDLAPGESVRSVVTVTVSGLPGTARDIVVSAGDTEIATATVAHGQMPWLLLIAGALGLHVAALTVRDRLRARIARSVGPEGRQPSPSQTWARSSR